jgi:hypothetical protein
LSCNLKETFDGSDVQQGAPLRGEVCFLLPDSDRGHISSAAVALTVSDQNVLSIALNPQAAAKVSDVASGTTDEKLSSQRSTSYR